MDEIAEYETKRADYLKEKELLEIYRGKDTVTADGTKVALYGNIGNPEDAKGVVAADGEGVGLFRTEFLFMGTDSLPTEDEQFEAYKAAAETMQGKEVIIRTLDVGGDKDIPYLGLEKEDNPFLGFRAVRYCLKMRTATRYSFVHCFVRVHLAILRSWFRLLPVWMRFDG